MSRAVEYISHGISRVARISSVSSSTFDIDTTSCVEDCVTPEKRGTCCSESII
jgi:hypothetical protein